MIVSVVMVLVGVLCAAGSRRAAVGRCPDVDSDFPTFLPDSEYCTTFYECYKGRPYQVQGAAGLHFSPIHRICEYPILAKCTAPKNSSPSHPLGSCPPFNGPDYVFFADAAVCSIFYQCDHGVAVKQECPASLHWNRYKNMCEFPTKAGCQIGWSMGLRAAVSECPPSDGAHSVYIADSRNCSRFFKCRDGRAINKR